MKTRIVFFTGLMCLLSTLAVAQKVYVNYNHATDITKFKTYAWGQGQNPNAIQDPIALQNAQQEVNSQLAVKDLQMVQESQNPDIIVVLSSGIKQETSYNAWGTGGGWRMGGGMGEITPETSNIGSWSSIFMTQTENKWCGAEFLKARCRRKVQKTKKK